MASKEERILQEFNIDNCRVCIDINQWREKAQKLAFSVPKASAAASGQDCPPDSLALGRATWTFLHTMAAYYPDQPSVQQQSEMSRFMHIFSTFYPCGYCAQHLREELKTTPPATESRWGLSQWLCRIHNEVNERLGKPLFDCARVDERWRDGPKDGSCN